MKRVVVVLVLLAACRRETHTERQEIAKKLEGIQPGEERDIGGGVSMKMFRLRAEEPIGDGWHRAVSTEGGFSVELPLPFNDFRSRNTTQDGVDLRTNVVGAKTPGLLAWTASCVARSDGKLSPDGRAPRPPHTEAQPPKGWLRTVDFEDMSCVLIVEKQGTDPLPSDADRERFLGSLKRTGKPIF
jgi:hypothetical protein